MFFNQSALLFLSDSITLQKNITAMLTTRFSSILTENEKVLIQNEAPKALGEGGLTQLQLDLIYQKRWFHLLVPKNCGGAEMSLPDFSLLMEELAAVEGSFAWVVNLGAGANMFAGYMKQTTAKKIFASSQTCIAGSGVVGGKAVNEQDGYRISGHWKYASGSAHANFFSLNAKIERENAVKSFLVPAAQVTCLDTWRVMGLQTTGSCEFKVENVWVPKTYCFDLQTASPWSNSTLYRFPFNTLAEINMLVMITGLAMHFRQLAEEIVSQKTVNQSDLAKKIVDHPQFQQIFTEKNKLFEAGRRSVFDQLHLLWNKIEEKQTIQINQQLRFTQTVLETASATRNLVDTLYPFLGMNPVFTNSLIGKVYRDFKVASQHALLSPLRK